VLHSVPFYTATDCLYYMGTVVVTTPSPTCRRSMDIDHAVRLTLSHRLFSAFIHVMNRGLLDFTTPIDALLAHAIELPSSLIRALLRNKGMGDGGPASSQAVYSGSGDDRRAVGLKMMLYIQVRPARGCHPVVNILLH
jgi:hypothetical protein